MVNISVESFMKCVEPNTKRKKNSSIDKQSKQKQKNIASFLNPKSVSSIVPPPYAASASNKVAINTNTNTNNNTNNNNNNNVSVNTNTSTNNNNDDTGQIRRLKPPPPNSKTKRATGGIMSHHTLSAATILKEVNALIDNPTYSMKECNNISVQCTAVVVVVVRVCVLVVVCCCCSCCCS